MFLKCIYEIFMIFDVFVIYLFQAGTRNPEVTLWLRDLKNDSMLNVTKLNKPQALHMERLGQL